MIARCRGGGGCSGWGTVVGGLELCLRMFIVDVRRCWSKWMDGGGAGQRRGGAEWRGEERLKPQEEKVEEDKSKVGDLRGSPTSIDNLKELINKNYAIVSSSIGPEYYIGILPFVDKDQLEPGCAILMHNKVLSVVGFLQDEVDPMVSVMRLS
ncbi:hypothetical protein VNO80_03243 [Phaseolus coccineus]|uniref:Proteasomal ATPase second OB domain-containing protein n=1 Tax=Phaseolus coccineus TaxID=3886 RepID=A0AAN9RMA6_PHACN